jgi:four helix bundle protein
MGKKLEELPVFKVATAFVVTVTAILERQGCGRDRKLRDQIGAANDSILANMSEGFEQSSDAGLARFLYWSKASLAEVLTRMAAAQRKGLIKEAELTALRSSGDVMARMLAGWIRYLARCGWKDRGRHTLGADPQMFGDGR